MKAPSDSDLRDAVSQLDRVRKQWLRRDGVTAVDVGYKLTGGELTDQLAARVHVKSKKPLAAVALHEHFPSNLGRFATDVIEAEYTPGSLEESAPLAAGHVGRTSSVDPLIGGISVGHFRVTGGTLGAIVWDRRDGEVCILGSWHVLCVDSSCKTGDPIYQPARVDGGSTKDQVAELKRWHISHECDAALARLRTERGYSRDILDLCPVSGIEDPGLGTEVRKSGRGSGVTSGIIDGVSMSVVLDYPPRRTLHHQFHLCSLPFLASDAAGLAVASDSGSVWLISGTSKAVGLLIASERGPSGMASFAVASPIGVVIDALDFSFGPVFKPSQRIPPFRGENGKPSAPPAQPLHPEKLTVAQIIGPMTPAQIWALLAAVVAVLSSVAAAAYKLGAFLGSSP